MRLINEFAQFKSQERRGWLLVDFRAGLQVEIALCCGAPSLPPACGEGVHSGDLWATSSSSLQSLFPKACPCLLPGNPTLASPQLLLCFPRLCLVVPLALGRDTVPDLQRLLAGHLSPGSQPQDSDRHCRSRRQAAFGHALWGALS